MEKDQLHESMEENDKEKVKDETDNGDLNSKDRASNSNEPESRDISATIVDEKTDTSDLTSTNNESSESEVFQEDENKTTEHLNEMNRHLDYGGSLLQDNIYYEKEIQVRPELIESLTEGFTQKFLPSLERNRKTIDQIRTSQSVLMETVQQENAKFHECQALNGLETMMTRAKVYQTKLLRLRKDMSTLHEKSAKLKRRALRLQQQKQKEELTLAQRREDEYEKEKMLRPRIARPAPDSSM